MGPVTHGVRVATPVNRQKTAEGAKTLTASASAAKNFTTFFPALGFLGDCSIVWGLS
jgi:hypothetical protein